MGKKSFLALEKIQYMYFKTFQNLIQILNITIIFLVEEKLPTPLFTKSFIHDSLVTAFKYFNSKEEDWVRKILCH